MAPNYSRLESLNPFISFNRSIPRVHDLYPDHVFLVYFSNFKKKILLPKKNYSKNFFFLFRKKKKFLTKIATIVKIFATMVFAQKCVATILIVATNLTIVAITFTFVALLGGQHSRVAES